MMKMIFLIPLSALTVACSTTTNTPQKDIFLRVDEDKDGMVNRKEATELIIEDAFKLYDLNNDGYVDEQEYIKSGGASDAFAKINKSGTGKATLEEAKSNKRIFNNFVVSFDEADVNKDGFVSFEEYVDYTDRVRNIVR